MFHFQLLTMQKLLSTNAHLGYKKHHSDFQPYLYGFRNGIAIIDLEKTLVHLRRACNIIELIIRSKGHLLFVNTNPEYNQMVQQTAKASGQSYVNHKWVGGFLTNWNHMQNVQQHFQDFDLSSTVNPLTKERSSSFMHFDDHAPIHKINQNFNKSATIATHSSLSLTSKLSLNSFPRFKKMQKCFEGFVGLKNTPDCLIVLNANQNSLAINEANQLNIPVISLVDSNISNQLLNAITYPIAVNENSLQFVYLFCNCILKTILLAQHNAFPNSWKFSLEKQVA